MMKASHYGIRKGLVELLVIDGKEYLIPMVTEEPSVIAAAEWRAAIVKQAEVLQMN